MVGKVGNEWKRRLQSNKAIKIGMMLFQQQKDKVHWHSHQTFYKLLTQVK